MDSTHDSLLDRLRRDSTPADWGRFVDLYGPLLEHWARRLCPPHEAADLVQETLVRAMEKLRSFTGQDDRSFLAWLRVVMLNRWRDLTRRAAARPRSGGPATLDRLHAADDPEARGAADDRQFLIRRALQIMQADFEPSTWRACWEAVAVDRPAAEVAAELGVSVDVVYAATYRVIRRLRRELAGAWD